MKDKLFGAAIVGAVILLIHCCGQPGLTKDEQRAISAQFLQDAAEDAQADAERLQREAQIR